MTYSFQPFLDALGENWYDDDPLLRTLLAHHAGPGAADEEELGAWGGEVAGPLRELAEASARPENRPRLRRWDAYGRRVDRIELPASTRRALAEVLGRRGMGAVHGDPHVFYARAYLYAQNGESGVVCSMACTDGLVRALEALGDRPVHRRALERVRSSGPERVWHGAQFVTEMQGGSDVPANRARARPDGDAYRVDGKKWFCSNVNADYFLVTARPGGEGDEPGPVGLFLVPARLDESPGERNGHTIDRLKEKLGTRELATAEVTFRGARAWPVGPLERGLPNLLAHVLVTSRFHCVYWAASALRRAERIAAAYAGFRRAFGAPIADYPLVEEALGRIRGARRRALAATFGLLERWEEARAAGPDQARSAPEAAAAGRSEEARADFRVLLSLAKPVLTRRATEGLHEAMAILGGNGIEERFSPLPRLWRDAAIMETWEGPHNVLFTQALRDLERLGIEPGGFLERVAGEGGAGLVDELAGLLARSDEEDVTVPFARLAPRIVDAFAERVLEEAGAGRGGLGWSDAPPGRGRESRAPGEPTGSPSAGPPWRFRWSAHSFEPTPAEDPRRSSHHETEDPSVQVQVNSDGNIEGGDRLVQEVKEMVSRSLERFGNRITRVEVHLSDINAEKGGRDTRCVMEARVSGLDPVAVDELAEDVQGALRGAVGKLRRALDSRLGKLGDR